MCPAEIGAVPRGVHGPVAAGPRQNLRKIDILNLSKAFESPLWPLSKTTGPLLEKTVYPPLVWYNTEVSTKRLIFRREMNITNFVRKWLQTKRFAQWIYGKSKGYWDKNTDFFVFKDITKNRQYFRKEAQSSCMSNMSSMSVTYMTLIFEGCSVYDVHQ